MKKEQILKKAIEKAEKNGFKLYGEPEHYIRYWQTFIYNHDFAKAFWGEDEWYFSGWRGKLKDMVLKKEPLKYIEKFLEV